MRVVLTLICAVMMSSAASAAQFEAGQVWKYQTRPQEKRSTLTVVRVDAVGEERVIHISLVGLKMKNPRQDGGYSETVSHLPISQEALEQSVTQQIGYSDELPQYEEGYALWRKAFESGRAGYFTIPVAECIEYMERALNP